MSEDYDFQILSHIAENPDTTQADLATQLGVAVGSVTILTDNSVGTLRGWLDETRLTFGIIDQDGNTTTALITTAGQVIELSPNVAVGVLR